MQKSKLTLIIDGNWLLMSRWSVLNARYQDDVQMCRDLKQMMINSISIVLRQFPQIDNIIFVSDGGSWRNEVQVPAFIQGEYKGNREQDPDVNWALIFKNYEDFMMKLQSAGITTAREPGIEGDDWVWYWSTKLNSEGTNVIVWTKDRDLTQLVKTDQNKCFTVWWNKESGIICDDFQESDMNFLLNFEYNVNEDLLTGISDRVKQVTHIDPHEVVLDKVIRGDAGDNIFPILQRHAKAEGSTKMYRIARKDIDFSLDIHDEQAVRRYIHTLLEMPQYKGRVDKTEDQAVEHFMYNVKLVALEESSYPEDVLARMREHDTYECSKNINEAQYQITAESNDITSILDMI